MCVAFEDEEAYFFVVVRQINEKVGISSLGTKQELAVQKLFTWTNHLKLQHNDFLTYRISKQGKKFEEQHQMLMGTIAELLNEPLVTSYSFSFLQPIALTKATPIGDGLVLFQLVKYQSDVVEV